MSGSCYNYYYPRESPNYGMNQNHNWNQWSPEQQSYSRGNASSNIGYNGVNQNQQNHINMVSRNHNFYNQTNRYYPKKRYSYSNSYHEMPNTVASSNWQARSNYKRQRQEAGNGSGTTDINEKTKGNKKRKKPLSQNIPNKRDWSLEDAQKALDVEKEYNRAFKHNSLIIKFPDLELNRDVVSTFHSAIENVHFQQPSTPRFCFVTLRESADAETVIRELNKVKFGDGYLTAEFKKDREEDQNIGPEDIDPMTLYVGNLAQEITKDDMVKTYPKQRRIDIGYAKKMKYTRYAFVSFKTVEDSIEAFKRTHSTQMYSKSIIVRFRRLHGTVGMPGETKTQNLKKPENTPSTSNGDNITSELNNSNNLDSSREMDVNTNFSSNVPFNLSVVKHEYDYSDEEYDDDENYKPNYIDEYKSTFLPGDISLNSHRPIKQENNIKTEDNDEEYDDSDFNDFQSFEDPSYQQLRETHIQPKVIKPEINIKQEVKREHDQQYDENQEYIDYERDFQKKDCEKIRNDLNLEHLINNYNNHVTNKNFVKDNSL